ncbi:hypothetical protein ACWGQ9_21135 [Streptomyces parvus]
MQWTTVVSTLIGAAIGIASTLLVDASRARRDEERHWKDYRRQVYSDFLAVLSTTAQALRTAALSTVDGSERESAIREAYQASEVESARERVRLSAPPSVVDASTEVIRSLEVLRDHLADGLALDSPEHGTLHWAYWATLHELRQSTRKDLGLEVMEARMSFVLGPSDPTGT